MIAAKELKYLLLLPYFPVSKIQFRIKLNKNLQQPTFAIPGWIA